MSNGFTIQVQGIDKLQTIFKELPRQTQSGITSELYAIKDEWVGKAKADAPVDRARTKQSVNGIVSDLTLTMSAQSESAPYMEFGTKTFFKSPAILGSYPSEFKGSGTGTVNPITALTEWVRRKGLAANYSISTKKRTTRSVNEAALEKSIAFLIYRKIKKYGVHAHPFLFTGKDGSDRVSYFYNKLKTNIADVLKQIV